MRRGASIGCMRRVTRWGSVGPTGGAPTVAEILAAQGANAREWWTVYDPSLPADPGLALSDPGTGDVVDSWTGQIAGYVVPAPGASNRPPYALDGAFFNGHRAVQFATSGSRHLFGVLSGVLCPAGSQPFFAIALRERSAATGSFPRVFEIDSAAKTFDASFGITSGGAGAPAPQWYYQGPPGAPGGVRVDAGTPDLAAHVALVWNDSTDGIHIVIDGVEITAPNAGTGVLSANSDRIAIGGNVAGTACGDVSMAELIVLGQYPGADVAVQLTAAMRSKWGI